MALKKVVAMAFEGQRNITSIKLQMARNLSVDEQATSPMHEGPLPMKYAKGP